MITSILYIEDDLACQTVIKALLENAYNCCVDATGSGCRGVELTQLKSYELIIMDIGLPDITGIEAAKLIKLSNPSQLIVSSSGHRAHLINSDELMVFDHHFSKPFANKLSQFESFCQRHEIILEAAVTV